MIYLDFGAGSWWKSGQILKKYYNKPVKLVKAFYKSCNKLHFIGHSLGAQISAQVSHLLKKDNFWEAERITGLDPAKPCFVGVHETLRLDKEDADFVDVIHTDIGEENTPWGSLGVRKPIGKLESNQ